MIAPNSDLTDNMRSILARILAQIKDAFYDTISASVRYKSP